MIKKIVLVTAFLMALVSTTANKSYAVSPTGQGIFIVSNCNTIVSPVTNGSYCLVGTTISVWNGSAWVPVASGGGGGAINTLPNQSGNYNAQGFKMGNFGQNTVTGDALSQNQSRINDLATATAAYSMGGNKIQSLAVGTTSGDALVYALSHLNDMAAATADYNMNTHGLTGQRDGVASGEGNIFGQQNGQFTTGTNLPIRVSVNSAATGAATSITINAPSLITTGNGLVAAISWSTTGTFTPPSGWTQLRSDTNTATSTITTGWFCKQATGSEPSNYTWNFTASASVYGGIAQFAGLTCANYDTGSAAIANGITTTLPALSGLAQANEFIVTQASYLGGANVTPDVGTQVISRFNDGFGMSYNTTPSKTAPATTWKTCGALCNSATPAGFQVSQATFTNTSTLQNASLINGQQNGQVISLFPPSIHGYPTPPKNQISGFGMDGCEDIVAHGADPTGGFDAAPAVQEAYDAACASPSAFFGPSAGGCVNVPQGTYVLKSPILMGCTKQIAIHGAGQTQSVFVPGNGSTNWGMQWVAMNSTEPTLYNPILTTSIATGTGSAIKWGPAPNGQRYFLNLSSGWMGLNGNTFNRVNNLSAFTNDFYFNPTPITSATNGQEYGIASLDNLATDPNAEQDFVNYWTYSTGGTSTITFCLATTGNPAPTNSNQGPPKCITGNVTNSANHFIEFNFDGNLHLAIDGNFVSQITSSGNTIQPTDSDWYIGSNVNHQGANDNMAGVIDSYRLSNIVRHAQASGNYTPPTAKFTQDGNTLALLNALNSKNVTISGVQYTGAIQMGSSGFGAWIEPLNSGCCFQGNNLPYFGDMTISSFLNNQVTGPVLNNLGIGTTFFADYYAVSEAYSTTMTNSTIGAGGTAAQYSMRLDGNSPINFTDTTIFMGPYGVIGRGGGYFKNSIIEPTLGTLVDFQLIGDGSIFGDIILENISTDAENGGTSIPVVVGQGLKRVSITHSNLLSAGGSPAVSLINVGPSLLMDIQDTQINGSITFGSFGVGGSGNNYALMQSPILLLNDDVQGNAVGGNGGNPCTIPAACTVVGKKSQADSWSVQTSPPSLLGQAQTSTGAGTSVSVARQSATQSGDIYIAVLSQIGANPGLFTAPTGWTQDSRCTSLNSGSAGTQVFYHVASLTDPSSWSFTWANSTHMEATAIIARGGPQNINPIDSCFPVNGTTGTAVALTGGTANNINDTVISYVAVNQNPGGVSVGSSPPTGLTTITASTSTPYKFASWYVPASVTIPTVNYVISNSVAWSGIQIALANRIQSTTAFTSGQATGARVTYDGQIAAPVGSIAPKQNTLTESGGGTLTPDLSWGGNQEVIISDNTGWTLANPLSDAPGHWWQIELFNNTGGAGGTITLGSNYKTDSSWSTTGPGTTKKRVCRVYTESATLDLIGPCSADM